MCGTSGPLHRAPVCVRVRIDQCAVDLKRAVRAGKGGEGAVAEVLRYDDEYVRQESECMSLLNLLCLLMLV